MTAADESTRAPAASPSPLDGAYAWWRAVVCLAIGTVGGIGIWATVVVLPAIQKDFGILRGEASLAFTATMIGFAFGGILMGRLTDRFDIRVPCWISAIALGIGFAVASQAPSLPWFAACALFIGFFGVSATFAPLIADTSHWFLKRRGIAVAVVASGNYLAGTVWPPLLRPLIDAEGWRFTYLVIAGVCVLTILPLSLALKRPPPFLAGHDGAAAAAPQVRGGQLSPRLLQVLLVIAGLSCCIAMSMPQVHIVAYCVDLGHGLARGAEMLSLMLGFGVVSRIAFGALSDRFGGVATLLISSSMQAAALLFYIPFDGLTSLYIVSALFGLAQGGIVPSYAIIVREYFAPQGAATRIGVIMMATIVGMAVGGWMSGAIYDATGSYLMAFLNGIAWNLVNMSIALWLLLRGRGAKPDVSGRLAPA
ncbi:MAG: MFS transporter [Pseudomonadota bacterium]